MHVTRGKRCYFAMQFALSCCCNIVIKYEPCFLYLQYVIYIFTIQIICLDEIKFSHENSPECLISIVLQNDSYIPRTEFDCISF